MEKRGAYPPVKMPTATNSKKCRSLPEDIRRLVRSGIVITSISQCVEELVLNAIDAGAENVYINADFDSFSLEIDDDGFGISKEDLEIVGSRFTTSKCHSFADLSNMKFYGFRGETLASLIEVSSSVNIISKSIENNAEQLVYCKSFNNEDGCTPVRQADDILRYEKGTLVRIHNVLGLFPVRQKRINKVLQIEEIKQSLQYICLINPRLSLTLINNGADSNKILNIQARNSVRDSFGEIFCKASELIKFSRTLIEEHHQFSSFFFTACISTEMSPNKDLQIIFINKRFICRGKIHRSLHRLISDVLNGKSKKKTEKCNSSAYGNSFPTESKKCPVFVVNIICPFNEYDIVLQTQKSDVEFCNWETLLKGCEGLALRFKSIVQALSKSTGKNGILHQVFPLVQSNLEVVADADGIGTKITTHDVRRALHSKVALRQDNSVKANTANQEAASVGNKNSEQNVEVLSTNMPSTSRAGQESPMLKLVRSRPVGISRVKRRQTDRYHIVGKKAKTMSSTNPSPKLTGHIFNGFAAFQSKEKEKTEELPKKTKEEKLSEGWQDSQQWSTHLQALSVGTQAQNTPKKYSKNQNNINPQDSKASKKLRSPTLSPLSRSAWKVQSWKNHNLAINAPQSNMEFVSFSQISDSSDLNNNASPGYECIGEDFHFLKTNKVIAELANKMGNPDSMMQIKEDCKKILMSSSAGLATWNSIKDLVQPN